MAQEPKLQVDIADVKDIKAKISSAEKIWKEKRSAVREAEKEADHWAGLVDNLKSMAGIVTVDESTAGSSRPSPAQDAVVRIVQREGRPMRPVEVAKQLKAEGNQVTSSNAVNAALYAAAEAGRLRRPGPRQYAPRLRKAKRVKKTSS
jgi:hypothetical protein